MFGMVTALVVVDPSAAVTGSVSSASTTAVPFVCPIPTAG
jgi:hypothetical protein